MTITASHAACETVAGFFALFGAGFVGFGWDAIVAPNSVKNITGVLYTD